MSRYHGPWLLGVDIVATTFNPLLRVEKINRERAVGSEHVICKMKLYLWHLNKTNTSQWLCKKLSL